MQWRRRQLRCTVDEGFSVGVACTAGLGACLTHGTTVCAAGGGGTSCSSTPGSPSTEVCDGIDNDCDGAVDNGGSALCAGATNGTACVAGATTFCGCALDSDCGTATSGRVCDLSSLRCTDGCASAPGETDARLDSSARATAPPMARARRHATSTVTAPCPGVRVARSARRTGASSARAARTARVTRMDGPRVSTMRAHSVPPRNSVRALRRGPAPRASRLGCADARATSTAAPIAGAIRVRTCASRGR